MELLPPGNEYEYLSPGYGELPFSIRSFGADGKEGGEGKNADIIILGPGSLYTSVIPNLLVKDISKAIAASNAKKIYICNVMTQPGETDNYAVSDHLKALINHSGSSKIVDTVMVNDYLPKQSLEVYQSKNSYPVKIDDDVVKKMGIKIYKKCVINLEEGKFLRHSSRNLARAIYVWYRRQGRK